MSASVGEKSLQTPKQRWRGGQGARAADTRTGPWGEGTQGAQMGLAPVRVN